MTYSAGTRILAEDYNTLGAGVNQTWSTAYGQTAVGTVNTNVKVTATNWGTLVNTLSNQALHQATAITARTAPQTGNLIAIFNSLSTDVTTTYNNRYNAYALGTQYTAWTGTSSKTTDTVLGLDTDPWTIVFNQTVQFASASALSRFFNAGGLIKLQFSKTSTGLPNDTYWNAFIATCGDVYLSATAASKIIAGISFVGTTRIGGTGGATVATGIGVEQLTVNPTTIFEKSPTDYLYQSSYVRVQARVTATHQLVLETTWFQQERNPAPGPTRRPTSISGGAPASGVSVGTAPTTICTYFPPESTYLTNTWGTPTVSSQVSGPVLQQYSYSTPGVYNFTVPATLSGSLIVSLMVGAGGGGGGSQFQGDGHGAANGGSGGYYTNTEVAASAGLNLVVAVGAGGAGVPAANSAGGSAGGLSSMSTGGPGFGLVAGGGGGGAGVFGDNSPAFGGSAGSPNGSPGSNTANWMVQRNTQGNGYNGTGQNGTGYGDGGLGGNSNGPVGQGTAGGNGIVNFQLAVTVTT